MGDAWTFQHLLPYAPAYMVAIAMIAVILRSGPSFLERWNERQRDVADAKAGDWSRLRGEIKRLDERCAKIELREQECQRLLTDAVQRIGQLEGYNLGVGEAHQTAQRMLSEEREADRIGKDEKK